MPKFEEILSPMVYGQLQEQLPQLYRYMIGYETVAEEQEGKKILGMIAFNVNGKYYLLSTFYINGFLKPLIHLFDYQSKIFMPAIKEVVEHIIKTKPGIMAEPINRDAFRQALSIPNLYKFTMSPTISKFGEYKGFQHYLKKASNRSKANFFKVLRSSDSLCKQALLWFPNMITNASASSTSISNTNIAKTKKANIKQASDLIIKTVISTENTPDENEQVARDGMVILDSREKASEVIPDVLESQVYVNPTKTGRYNLFCSDGKFKEMYIFVVPSRDENNEHLIYAYDNGLLYNITNDYKNVWGIYTADNLELFKDKLVPLKESEAGKYYMLFRNDLKKFTDPVCLGKNNEFTWNGWSKKIVFNPYTKNTLDYLDGNRCGAEVVISNDTLLLPVENTCEYIFGSYEQLYKILQAGGFDKLKIVKEGMLYKINNEEKPYKEALIDLVANKGIREKQARHLLNIRGSFLVKKAYTMQEMPTYEINNAPMETSYAPTMDHEPVLNPYVEAKKFSGEIPDMQRDIMIAMQAAASGKPEILDPAFLGILAKSENNNERIKEIVPVLSKATHALGTQLFDIWWRPENYTQDYTVDDLYALEESVLSTFKNLGSIIIKLISSKYKDAVNL